jgi:hypothetical protein
MTPVLHTMKESVDTVAASVAVNLLRVGENLQTARDAVAVNLHRVGENLQTARIAVAQDLRALWSGMEHLQHLQAANDAPEPQPEPDAQAPDRPWRVPVGWISLVAAGSMLLGIGLAHITLVEVARKDSAAQKRSGREKRQFKRVPPPSRTDWSREG